MSASDSLRVASASRGPGTSRVVPETKPEWKQFVDSSGKERKGEQLRGSPNAGQGLCRAMWTQYKSNPSTRNSDARLSAKVNLSFEKVLLAHDPKTITITSFEHDTPCRVSRFLGEMSIIPLMNHIAYMI